MNTSSVSPSRVAGTLLPLIAAAWCGLAPLRGDEIPVQLAPVVVSATRVAQSAASVGTAVDSISGTELERQQLQTFSEALSGTPGAPVFATGNTGASVSTFMRGANSNQVLFLVDGIRMNDSNTDYGPFIGGARVFSTDTIEVARGPQSTLYGAEAIGGVVSISSAKGEGQPTESVSAEAGSFSTVDGIASVQGGSGPWGYNAGIAASHTENDRPNNAFSSSNVMLRIDRQVSSGVALGATVRGFVARYGDPSDEYTNDPSAYVKERNFLGTLFADAKLTPEVTTHLIVGGQDRQFIGVDPMWGLDTLVKNRRAVVDWQANAELPAHNRLVAGLNAETQTTRDTGYGHIDQRQGLAAAFAEDEWAILEDLRLTGGLRWDDFDTFGKETTGRATLAWLTAGRTLKLRSSYGTGFNAPSFLDLYGTDAGYVGNPRLKPESSRGWDAGFDVYLPAEGQMLSATWFQSDIDNLIADDFSVYPFTTKNIGQARTRGLELSATALVGGVVKVKASYTRLDAIDRATAAPLLRRPRNQAGLDASGEPVKGLSVGVGAGWVGTRSDVDPQTYLTATDPAYATARVYAAWQATARLTVKARIENLFNRRFEPVAGYPALGRGLYGGAEWKF